MPWCCGAPQGRALSRHTACERAPDLNSLRNLLRKAGIPEPPIRPGLTRHLLKAVVSIHARAGGPVLDLGCGAEILGGTTARMDYTPSPATNVLGDPRHLPFPDAAFSLVVCKSVLEHVRDYRLAIAEITRVVRPGGEIWVEIPWLYMAHPDDPGAMHDYVRLSATAYDFEFAQFERIALGPAFGAGSTLSLILPEYFALFFSMRNHTALYNNLRNLLLWVFYPLRWTDCCLIRKRYHERISGGFYFHGRKWMQ